MLPARGAVVAEVAEEFAALGDGVPAEGGVGLAGEERLAEREEFLSDRGEVLDEGECRTSRTFGLARSASSHVRSSSHENSSSRGPSTCVGGFSKRQNSGVGAR